jgi:hypothetical protein
MRWLFQGRTYGERVNWRNTIESHRMLQSYEYMSAYQNKFLI